MVSRISFCADPFWSPTQDPIQHTKLFKIVLVSSEFADHFDEETLVHSLLDPLQVWVGTDKDKVVSMNDAT
jgi:hypothetical protein